MFLRASTQLLKRQMRHFVTKQRADDELVAAVARERRRLFGAVQYRLPPLSPEGTPERKAELRRMRIRLLTALAVLCGLVVLIDRAVEQRMEAYEYLPTLFEALANDDGAELDVALAGVLPLNLLFVSSLLVHLYELVELPPVSPLSVFVAVERRLRQERFSADDARHCAALVRDLRARHTVASSLFVPFAWLELRIQLRAFADEDEHAPANAAPVDPLRRIDAIARFLHVATPHIATLAPSLRDRCHLACLVAELIIANEALAVDRCRVGLDAAYDVLTRLQAERLALSASQGSPARGAFTGLVQHNVVHTIALICASFGRFDAVRDIDNASHPTLGDLVLSRDLAEGRALQAYVPRLVRLDSVERASTLVMLAAQHLAATDNQSNSSLLFRATAPLEAVALATQNLALLLLLESPQESIRRFKHAFKAINPSESESQSTAVAVLDLDEFLEAEIDARRRRGARSTDHFADFDQLLSTMDNSSFDVQLEALEFLEHASADEARLAFVRGKLWHQFRATQHAVSFYDEALRLLDRSSGDYAVVQTYRRRAAQTLARVDDKELVTAHAAEEAERSLMALARVAAANGITSVSLPLPRPQAPKQQLLLKCVSEDDLNEAIDMAWTSIELGGMCSPCMRRQRLRGLGRLVQLPGADNAIDWRWLYEMQREWTNERSQ